MGVCVIVAKMRTFPEEIAAQDTYYGDKTTKEDKMNIEEQA